MKSKDIGNKGEKLAIEFLQKQGYIILEQNYKFEKGEIDIIALKNNEIIFVEVKTSKDYNFVKPEDKVSKKQQETLKKTAYAYLYETKLTDFPARFDLIIVELEDNKIYHYENVFF